MYRAGGVEAKKAKKERKRTTVGFRWWMATQLLINR
jgi:hypothetical protein